MQHDPSLNWVHRGDFIAPVGLSHSGEADVLLLLVL
jgi:hypothetical protein